MTDSREGHKGGSDRLPAALSGAGDDCPSRSLACTDAVAGGAAGLNTRRSPGAQSRAAQIAPGTHTALISNNALRAVPTGNQPTHPDTKNDSPKTASMSPAKPARQPTNLQKPISPALTSRRQNPQIATPTRTAPGFSILGWRRRWNARSSPVSRSTCWRSATPTRSWACRKTRCAAGARPCSRPHCWSTRRSRICTPPCSSTSGSMRRPRSPNRYRAQLHDRRFTLPLLRRPEEGKDTQSDVYAARSDVRAA